jgi:hypothetical protein
MAPVAPALLKFADRGAQRLRLGEQPLEADEQVAAAERRAGRRFRNLEFEPGLRMLIESCEQEAELSIFGRVSLRWDIQRLLGNALRLERAEEEDPAIVRSPVDKPIFITGLPRSGTTFLHTLLSQDPGNMTPLSWQTMQPYPDRRDRARDHRVVRAERELRAFRHISPDVEGLHPLAATTPQECTEITAHVFQSLRFDTTYWSPSYLDWLEARGHEAAFRFHKRFLQHLQAQVPGAGEAGARRWVLKCPDHVFTLDAILESYPDARFVFVHRHPAAVLASVAKLTYALRAPFTRKLDKAAIGAQVSQRWLEGADAILAAAADLPGDRVLHLNHREITTEPLAALDRLYRYFDLPFTPAARARVAEFVARRPRGGYEVNRYDPAEFGLDLPQLSERFERYIRAFVDPAPQAVPA